MKIMEAVDWSAPIPTLNHHRLSTKPGLLTPHVVRRFKSQNHAQTNHDSTSPFSCFHYIRSWPSWNIRGLNSNIVSFQQFLQPLSPVALFLTETLSSLSPNTAHFQFHNCTLHYSLVPKLRFCTFV